MCLKVGQYSLLLQIARFCDSDPTNATFTSNLQTSRVSDVSRNCSKIWRSTNFLESLLNLSQLDSSHYREVVTLLQSSMQRFPETLLCGLVEVTLERDLSEGAMNLCDNLSWPVVSRYFHDEEKFAVMHRLWQIDHKVENFVFVVSQKSCIYCEQILLHFRP